MKLDIYTTEKKQSYTQAPKLSKRCSLCAADNNRSKSSGTERRLVENPGCLARIQAITQ